MRQQYNENITAIEIPLPATGSDAAPVDTDVGLFDDTIIEAWLIAGNATTWARVTNLGQQLIPVLGYAHLPQGTLDIKFERPVEGPPYILRVSAYNTGAAVTTLTVLIQTKNSREVDLDVMQFEELQQIRRLLEKSILGAPLTIPPKKGVV